VALRLMYSIKCLYLLQLLKASNLGFCAQRVGSFYWFSSIQ